jgi:uncharacterized protein YndB with AHSA1/START domain
MTDLKYEIYIGASPEKVWSTLFDPKQSAKVFHGGQFHSTLEIGTPYQYVGPDQNGKQVVHVEGKILENVPKRRLAMTMRVGESYGEAAKYESRVSYTLEAAGHAATRVTIVHDKWQEGDPTYQNTADGGWARILSNFKSLIETGQPLELPMH